MYEKHNIQRRADAMKTHIGTNRVTAQPMTWQEYSNYRGWTLPDGCVLPPAYEAEDGYLVEHMDGRRPNDSRHAGYISWIPKAQFDAAYRPTTGMTFGLAIEALKAGRRVARAGWNGKGMWLALVLGYDYNPDKGRAARYAVGCQKLPWIGMKTADDCFVPWLASQTDMLADDWTILQD